MNGWTGMKLSQRIRAGVEAAPWVVDEVIQIETENAALKAELAEANRLREQCRRKLLPAMEAMEKANAELAALRSASEPVYQVLATFSTVSAWIDVSKEKYQFYAESPEIGVKARVLYTTPQPAQSEPVAEKFLPCGCVLCTCEDPVQCHGCGAKFCKDHNERKHPQPAQSDAKDAQRYRWLRDTCTDPDIRAGLGWIGQDVGLDAAIDQAMQGEEK